MTVFDPDHPILPNGLTESDLLDWIEADARARTAATPGSAFDRVNRAIAADPALARALDAMRIDRAALGALETPEPPSWVAQAVLEEHERQSLLALSDLASRGSRAAQYDNESFSFSALPAWFKPAMAIAAVLALAFGAWQLIPLVLPGPAPTPGPIIAEGNGEAQPPEITNPVTPIEPQPVLVRDDSPAPMPTPRAIVPSASEVLAARLDIPVQDALALALDGRLLIVVDAVDTELALHAATAIAAQPVDTSWTLAEPPGELVAAMASPDHARFIGIAPDAVGPAIATGRGPLGQLEFVLASTPTVYMARASVSAEAVLSLLTSLEQLGGPCRVVVLDEALPAAGQTPAPISASSLLWWEGDPAAWEPWAAIPVRFIESR